MVELFDFDEKPKPRPFRFAVVNPATGKCALVEDSDPERIAERLAALLYENGMNLGAQQ